MKIKRKRFFALCLALLLSISFAAPCEAAEATQESAKDDNQDYFVGKLEVFTKDGGKRKVRAALCEGKYIMAEPETIASIAGMNLSEDGTVYEFERKGYFVRIDTEKETASIGIYLTDRDVHKLYRGEKFEIPIRKLEVDGEEKTFLSLEKTLYLMNVQWSCQDQCVYCYIPDETFWNVLADSAELFSLQPNYKEIFYGYREENGWNGYLYGLYATLDDVNLLRLAFGGEAQADRDRAVQAMLTLGSPCENLTGTMQEMAEQAASNYIGALTECAQTVSSVGGFGAAEAQALCQAFTAWADTEIPSYFGDVFDGLSMAAGVINAIQTAVRYRDWTEGFIDQLQIIKRLDDEKYPKDSEFLSDVAQSLLSEQGNAAGNIAWEASQSLGASLMDLAVSATPAGLFYNAYNATIASAKTLRPEIKNALDSGEFFSNAKRLCDLSIVLRSTYTDLLDQTASYISSVEELDMMRGYGKLYASVNAHCYDALYSAALKLNQAILPDATVEEASESGEAGYDMRDLGNKLIGNQTFALRFQETQQYDPTLILFESFDNLYSSENGGHREEIPPEYVIYDLPIRFSSNMGEYGGVIYKLGSDLTVQDISLKKLPIETPEYDYICSFLFYRGMLYFCCKEAGTSDFSCALYSCKPDGTDMVRLHDDVFQFYIENNRLYCYKTEYLDLADGKWKTDEGYSDPGFGSWWDDETFRVDALSGDGLRYIPISEAEDGTSVYGESQLIAAMDNNYYQIEIQTVAQGNVFFTYYEGDETMLYCLRLETRELLLLDTGSAIGSGTYFGW